MALSQPDAMATKSTSTLQPLREWIPICGSVRFSLTAGRSPFANLLSVPGTLRWDFRQLIRNSPQHTTGAFEDPDGDGVSNEIPTSIVDFMEFYLLNYFKPASYEQTLGVITGRQK